MKADTTIRTLAQLEERMGDQGHGDFTQDTTGHFQHHPRLTCTACGAEGVVIVGSHAYGTGIDRERECHPTAVTATEDQLNPFLAGIGVELEPWQKDLMTKTMDSHDEAAPPGPGSAWIG